GSGHPRRIRGDADRPRACARRARARPRPVRTRNPRRRSPPREEAQNLSQPRPAQRQPDRHAAAGGTRPGTTERTRPPPAGDRRRRGHAFPRRTPTDPPPPAVPPTRLAHTIVLAEGWWRILIAFLAGASSTLALAPTDVWPLPFITFPILVWLVDGAAGGRFGGVLAAAAVGWWFGFGYFLAGLYWVGHAFLVDAKTFGWLLPFAVVALPAGMALYTAFGLGLGRVIWTGGGPRVLALAVSLTLAEWLRGHLFSGFPWNAYGYALISPIWLAQGVALVGIWGLTFLAVAVYASPAVLADERADT